MSLVAVHWHPRSLSHEERVHQRPPRKYPHNGGAEIQGRADRIEVEWAILDQRTRPCRVQRGPRYCICSKWTRVIEEIMRRTPS